MSLLKKIFVFHYYKERFNRLFDFFRNSTLTIKLEKNKKITFLDSGKNSGLRYRSILSKEISTLEWIKKFETGSTFLDIGANVGTFSFVAAITKDCKVIAVEPCASSFSLLNINISINNLNEKILAFPFVASNKNDLDYLYLTDISLDGGGGLPYREIDARGNKFNAKYKQGIVCFKIDDLIRKLGRVDNIKIDVDGNEWELISGMKETLENTKVKSVMIELNKNGEKYEEIVNIFHQNNFSLNKDLTDKADISTKKGGYIYNHYFFKN